MQATTPYVPNNQSDSFIMGGSTMVVYTFWINIIIRNNVNDGTDRRKMKRRQYWKMKNQLNINQNTTKSITKSNTIIHRCRKHHHTYPTINQIASLYGCTMVVFLFVYIIVEITVAVILWEMLVESKKTNDKSTLPETKWNFRRCVLKNTYRKRNRT